MPDDQSFTLDELRKFDGEAGPILVAYNGIVYDLSDCPRWRNGLHEGLHFPEQDLTAEIHDAPHSEEVFNRPCVRRVGRLVRP